MPWHTPKDLLQSLNCTLKSTVREGVSLVEFKIAFIRKETVAGLRGDVLDVMAGDHRSGEIYEVFFARFNL